MQEQANLNIALKRFLENADKSCLYHEQNLHGNGDLNEKAVEFPTTVFR